VLVGLKIIIMIIEIAYFYTWSVWRIITAVFLAVCHFLTDIKIR